MPRYDFQCQDCSYTFEEERPFGDEESPTCPQCGGETRKLIAPPAIHFKGEGFYNTDRVEKEKKEKKEKKDLPEKESAKKLEDEKPSKKSEK